MSKLVIPQDDDAPRVIDLDDADGETLTIGRVSDNDIQIDDPSVSSHHARVIYEGGGWTLKDLDSTNGTRVNGENIQSARLEGADMVRFGKVEARFETASGGESKPLPEAGKVEADLADQSEKPSDFENASPFKEKTRKKDPLGTAAIALTVVAVLAFAVVMTQLILLKSPE